MTLLKLNATIAGFFEASQETPRKTSLQAQLMRWHNVCVWRLCLRPFGQLFDAATLESSEAFVATIIREKHWTKEQIAALTFSQVAQLNYDEMVTIVLDSGVPVRNSEYVHTMEGDTLMRHVYWARECCRRQLASPSPMQKDLG